MSGETATFANADAIARLWASKEVAPRDFMPEVREWETEEAVREAVKTGDLDQRQFVEEVQRRRAVTNPSLPSPTFVDQHPWKALDGGILVPFGTRVSTDGEVLTEPDPEEEEYNERRLFEELTGLNYDMATPDYIEYVIDEYLDEVGCWS